MIVDSSALRVLCLQADIAEGVLTMLKDAMTKLTLGDPRRLDTDVGPVIDAEALAALSRHVARITSRCWRTRRSRNA